MLLCTQSVSTIGGVETWLDHFCAGLDHRQWQPIVALVRGSAANDPDRFKRAHPELETVEIDGRGLPADSRMFAVMRCVRRISPEIFVPLVVADAHRAACYLRAGSDDIRYLLNLHGNTPPQLVEVSQHQAYADLAVAPGRLTCRLIAEAGMPPDRIRQVPNGSSAQVCARVPRQAGEPLRICYVGRLTQYDKRVGDLIGIAQSLSAQGVSYRLEIVGDGPERDRIEQGTRGLPVIFRGVLSQQEVYASVYPRNDVLLLTSEAEAFGIAVVEAMRNGVVPVTSRFGGLASEGLLEHGESGLVFPIGDTAAAAAEICRLATDATLWSRLSTAAQASTVDRYSWEACIAGWEAALTAIVESAPRAVPTVPPPAAPQLSGRGSRFHLSPSVTDAIRRARRRVFGVPAGMVGGEEWPWIYDHHDAAQLRRFEDAALALDRGDEAP